jgi:hypothetical protein
MNSHWTKPTHLLAHAGDLIVVDMRPDEASQRFPVPEMSLLPVSTEELMEALERLPSDRNVLLCAVTTQSIFLSDRKSCMRVSGPLSVLEDTLTRLEAA